MDLEAILELGTALPALDLTHLPGLHAKVYVADGDLAVVTSANLTEPGIHGNLEYGVALKDPILVGQVRRDFESYAILGAKILPADVEDLLNETRELKLLFKAAERSIRSRARRAFQEKLRTTQNKLLRQRAKGKTTQSMLCDAILFCLAKAPLRTEELHPLIQQLQPDLCDDSIDRVIDGVHFGKRWKHHVRSAQQYLKRTGRIRYDGELWHLVSGNIGGWPAMGVGAVTKIFVTVQNGIAEVCEDTVPYGIDVEILDFGHLAKDPKLEITAWSSELRDYWRKHHKQWGRCESDCRCRNFLVLTSDL